MSLYVLDVVFWILGIRGHIPQDGEFGAGPYKPSLAANANGLIRTVAAFVVAIAFLSLVLWAAIGLAIRLL